jgi:hypothetical protein
MGDYASVEIRCAEEDLLPEEREFMARLWESYFQPAKVIMQSRHPDAFWQREALREQVHADLQLPGTPRDWQYILDDEIDGQRYYLPLDAIAPAMIPPFPRRFGDVYRLRKKYDIKPTWYAMFSPLDQKPSDSTFTTPIGVARRQFSQNFAGLRRFLYVAEDESAFEALKVAASEGSKARLALEKVFDLFPFADYLQVLEFLAGDWGDHARVDLSFCEILWTYDEQSIALVHRLLAGSNRVFDALSRLDLAALIDEDFLKSDRRYDGAGVSAWLAPYAHHEPFRRFQDWLIPDSWE